MMKYSTDTRDLVSALDLASPPSCKTPATFIDSISPNNWQEKCKEPRNQIQLPTNRKRRAKRRGNRTQALVSLYWSCQSLHPKKPLNRISHKSTKVDPIRSSRTWKKSSQISKSYALQHIKILFPKNTRPSDTHYLGYKWDRHTQRED